MTQFLLSVHGTQDGSPPDPDRMAGVLAAGRVGIADAPLAEIIDWFRVHARELPWRSTRDIYAVWVAEVMSTQTTVARAAAAWTRWIRRWPTVDTLAAASLAEVLGEWQGLGYPRRARDLHRSARIVARSGWPDELTDLPGVGPYVASAIRCFALEQPLLPVDVNVRRVLARRLPTGVDITGDAWQAGSALMEFGQRICTARPRCELCPVATGCLGPEVDLGPVRRQQPFAGSLRQRRGRLLREVLSTRGMEYAGVDREAADGLVSDGLLTRRGARLQPPS